MPAPKKDRPRWGRAKFQTWLSVLEKREADEILESLCRASGLDRADALLQALRGVRPERQDPGRDVPDPDELRRLRDCSDAWTRVFRALRELGLPENRECESGVDWAVRMIRLLAHEAGR